MAVDVIMPAMGATQEMGRLVRWFKQEGDSVAKGEILMEVETDKSVVEVEAPASGILTCVTATPDDDIPVGQTIAHIIELGEELPRPQKPPKAGRRKDAVSARVSSNPLTFGTTVPALELDAGRLLASPAAKRVAKEKHQDLTGVKGTGPEGAVLVRDVLSATPDDVTGVHDGVVPLSRMRRVIGERMTSSKQTVPHFYLDMDVDMMAVEAQREASKGRGASLVPSINDFILSAVGGALAESPSMNAAWTEGGVRVFSEVNLGLAVAVDDGLVVPVIRNADRLSLDELAQRSREAADLAQNHKLQPADYQDGTFTVSNLGMFGIDRFTAIINPPQCGILAAGRVAPRVVPYGDNIEVRLMMTVTLSADHRVVDGVIAARFLQRVKRLLEDI